METLKRLREKRSITQDVVAEAIGVSRVAYTNYENGNRKPDFAKLQKLADYFGVTTDYLLGRSALPGNILHLHTKKIPGLGKISAGPPNYAEQSWDEYIDCDANIKADFCLRVRGDSMINARILDGDMVFIRQQDFVKNGEIAAVIIDDEATLKRVYADKDKVSLVAENSKYAPMVYPNTGFDIPRILGKALAFQSFLT